MDETKIEEETTDTDTTSTSEETSEEESTEAETVETEEVETDKDIDFEKELENLEANKKPTRSEREKAEYSFKSTAKRLKELGADPAEVLGIKPAEEKTEADKPRTEDMAEIADSVLTKRLAEKEARDLAQSEGELKVMMWYVENKNLSVPEAHLLANKGKIERFASEVKRANVKPGVGGGAGQKLPEGPSKMSTQELAEITRAGFKWNPTTKTYQAKFNEKYWDARAKKWLQRKISK